MLDLVLGARCAGCGAGGAWLCLACRDACDPATLRVTPSLTIQGAGEHEGPLREAIHRLKYGREPGLARELGALVAQRLAADLATGWPVDAVVPVVLHRARAAMRGYDQALLLAREVALRTGVPLRPAIHRVRGGQAQVRLDRAARAMNVRGAFIGEIGALRGLRVALVDDVATTGATIAAAASAARASGARGVRGYVVAVDA